MTVSESQRQFYSNVLSGRTDEAPEATEEAKVVGDESVFDKFRRMLAASQESVKQNIDIPLARGIAGGGHEVFGGEIPETQQERLEREASGKTEAEVFEEQLAERFGVSKEGFPQFLEGLIRRGTQLGVLPGVEAGNVVRGAVAGQTAEELGFGPVVQALSEFGGFAGKDIANLSRRLMPGREKQALVEGGRRLGLSEARLAPLSATELQKRGLGRIADRGGRVQNRLERTREALSNVFEGLKSSEVAASHVPPAEATSFLAESEEILREILNTQQRGAIQPDLDILLSGELTGERLINFWQKINALVGVERNAINLLRGPMRRAINSVSPELARDFTVTNSLWAEWESVNRLLRPTTTSRFLDGTEAARLVYGVFTGNAPLLLETAGEKGGRALAAEMLTNPVFKDLSRKFLSAVNQNKPVAAATITKLMAAEVEKLDPEIAEKIREMENEDFVKLLKSQAQK